MVTNRVLARKVDTTQAMFTYYDASGASLTPPLDASTLPLVDSIDVVLKVKSSKFSPGRDPDHARDPAERGRRRPGDVDLTGAVEMILKLSRLIRARAHGDEGIAMIMVMGTIMVLTVLLGVTLAYAISVQPQARHDQDWNAALACGAVRRRRLRREAEPERQLLEDGRLRQRRAQGPEGRDEHLRLDDGDPGRLAATSTPATRRPVASTTTWTRRPSTRKGVIRVTSTGKVNNVKRTIQVLVSARWPHAVPLLHRLRGRRPRQPARRTPAVRRTTPAGIAGPTTAKYWWDFNDVGARTARGCIEIQFVSFDVLNGKAHFNDTPLPGRAPDLQAGLRDGGPEVREHALQQSPTACAPGTRTPTVGTGYVAECAAKLYLPDSSDQFANYPGCFYTGDTRIRFKSDGTMDVWNTASVGTSVTGPSTPGGHELRRRSELQAGRVGGQPAGAGGGQNVPVPDDMVIYVKNSADDGACMPGQIVNGTRLGQHVQRRHPAGHRARPSIGVTDISYFDPDIVTTTTHQDVHPRHQHGVGRGRSRHRPPRGPTTAGDDHPSTFDCGQGNVYIEGSLHGAGHHRRAEQRHRDQRPDARRDHAADGRLRQRQGRDAVRTSSGLVARNSVVVYHPVSRQCFRSALRPTAATASAAARRRSATLRPPPATNGHERDVHLDRHRDLRQRPYYDDIAYPGQTQHIDPRAIYASIQTLQHSFWVDNYKYGDPLGKLSVRGSIAQKWRGIVGTGTTATSTQPAS